MTMATVVKRKKSKRLIQSFPGGWSWAQPGKHRVPCESAPRPLEEATGTGPFHR